MPPYLIPGLTPEAASDICMNQCRAMCCRGPLVLRLSPDEAVGFQEKANALNLDLTLTRTNDGSSLVKFADHRGECCPMLDQDTFACCIYADRPQRCRDFPEKPTPGCAISGG